MTACICHVECFVDIYIYMPGIVCECMYVAGILPLLVVEVLTLLV